MIRILLILIILGTPCLGAAETVNSVYVDGKAPTVIDGDLSDWNFLNLTPIRLTQFNQKYSKPEKLEGESDLSASFLCFSDEENIYVGVVVIDDQFVFGEAPIDMPYLDDCVEVFLYGSNPQTPVHIWVTANKEGKTKLEGKDPQTNKFIPYIWLKQGVKSSLRPIGNGYVVEIAVPYNVAIQSGWVKEKLLGLNVSVYDDDVGKEYDNILEWTTIWEDAINKISFINEIKYSQAVIEQFENEKELEVVVSEPVEKEKSEDPEVILGVAKAYERAGLYREANGELEKIIKNGKDSIIQNKAKLAIARNFF